MLWIPFPSAVHGEPPIAVADRSVRALEQAVLEPSRKETARLLAHAVLVDPWLGRWLARIVGQRADRPLESIGDLAAWWAEQVEDRFRELMPNADPAAWRRPTPEDAQRWASAAVACAQLGRQVAGQGDPLACPATLLAILSVTEVTVAGPIAPHLRAPLADYLQTDPGLEHRLPLLIGRLQRLTELEREFDVALERSKLAAMKELAYGASHEVNNPLANISGRAQTLLRDETDARRRRLLEAIDHQALRAHEMISDLMLFARPPALLLQRVDLGDLLQQAVQELSGLATEHQVELQWQRPYEQVIAEADPTQLLVAVKAIIQNSIEAIGQLGQVDVQLAPAKDSAAAVITIADTGPGIAEQVRLHLFDPFFSGREAGRGLGFGLSKCWRIVTDHGGTLHVANRSEGGATLTLELPNRG